MSEHFETSQWIPFPVELVFAFFANPQNLPHMMPPHLQARVEDMRITPPPPRPVSSDPARRFRSVAAGTGSEILISFKALKWLPRVSWTARIVEFAWNSHFIDEMARGPFETFRHRHGVAAEISNGVEGTRVTDAIDYELPGGMLGKLAARAVWKQMQQGFAFRHERLPKVLEQAAQQAARRA